jgi:hypothetical protein
MHIITTSGRRIEISIDQEDRNMHIITTSGRRIGVRIEICINSRPREWKYGVYNGHRS